MDIIKRTVEIFLDSRRESVDQTSKLVIKVHLAKQCLFIALH